MKTITLKVKVLAICGLFSLFSLNTFAQVGIGNTNPAASSLLDIRDNNANKGILIPRIDIADLNNASPVASPANSLLVYNINTTTGPGFFYWNSGVWVPLSGTTSGPNEGWALTGNAGTSPGTNFIGTRDNVSVQVKTNNAAKFDFTNNGRLRSYVDGSASEPTYSWNGANAQDMGMYRVGQGILGLSTNGIQRMRILENGKIAVNGNESWQNPFAYDRFVVYGGAGETSIRGYAGSGSASIAVWGENEQGGIGVNGTSFSNNGSSGTGVQGTNTGDGVGVSGIIFGDLMGTGVMGSASRGDGVGGYSTFGYGVYGAADASKGGHAGYFQGKVKVNGDLTVTGTITGIVTPPSDKRWKKNITSLNVEKNILKKVLALRPTSYNWRAAEFPEMGFDAEKKSFGFIAQELKEIFPELVYSKTILDPKIKRDSSEDIKSVGEFFTVDYTGLIPILTEAIQEQQQIINLQEERISKLESLVQELINKR